MYPSFLDMVLDTMRVALAPDRARAPIASAELAILGLVYLTSIVMVALGLLAMKGAAKDVLDVMDHLPPPPEKDGDRAAARTRAVADYNSLYRRRCAPGALLAGVWAFFLLCAVIRSVWWASP